MQIDNHMSIRPEKSFAEVCLACPIPGFNTIPIPREVPADNKRWKPNNKSDERYAQLNFERDFFMYVPI